MNVNDFNIEIPKGDKLHIIFNHQRHLMEKYHGVEERCLGRKLPSAPYAPDGSDPVFLHAGALDINDRESQLRFKSFAWRITEEITEATLCLMPRKTDEIHYLEEMVDALHFSVELMCMCGIGPYHLLGRPTVEQGESIDDALEVLFAQSPASPPFDVADMRMHTVLRINAFNCVEKIGEAMNRLKLKEWKLTAMLTDEASFKKSLVEFFLLFINLLKMSGFNATTLTQTYLNKNAVNQFRIRSHY